MSARDLSDLHAAAVAYCDAVYFARADVFETLCHDAFHMTLVEHGGITHWDKAAYLARVGGRKAGPGPAVYEIRALDAAGDMGRVHLTVDVPPVRYEDHLGFIHDGSAWRLLAKVFRVAETNGEGAQ